MRKLKRIFKEIPENKKKIVEKLIDNAAFMAEQLEHLQVDIEEKGYISEYQNGENQWGTKKAPEVEIYTATITYCRLSKDSVMLGSVMFVGVSSSL